MLYRAKEAIRCGMLVPSFIGSRSPADRDIGGSIDTVEEALQNYRDALANGIERYLVGRAVKPVF
jgi:glutamate-1-semialdehyde 2,1-aminomutase